MFGSRRDNVRPDETDRCVEISEESEVTQAKARQYDVHCIETYKLDN